MATNTGFLDINGTDLINAYFTNSNSTFTGVNVFNNGTTRGLISYNQTIIDSASTITYISTNVPNCILANGLNMNVSLNLPTSGVPNGFILNFRRNNGTGSQTYSFVPNIYDLTNASVSSFTSGLYSFALIHYNANWYVHFIK